MSWRLMEAVLDLRLPDEQERILVRLARYASDNGSRCFPGVAQLASDSGRSERAVQRTLRALEQGGFIVPVAHQKGGRGRSTEFQLMLKVPVKGDTDDTLCEVETVTQTTPITPERVTPVTERVTPVVIKGDTRVTPIDQEQIKGTDQLRAAAATEKTPLQVLSDGARAVLDDWRRKQGKTRIPTLNPVLARELEDAVVDLGVPRLIEANSWAAREEVTSLIKAIRAARTRRKRDENPDVTRFSARANGSNAPKPVVNGAKGWSVNT